MRASIWLQVSGDTNRLLHEAIAALAGQHGTMPFQPHLTVCGIPPDDPAVADAASAFVLRSGALPLRVAKVGVSYSTQTWSRAVVIDIENSDALQSFREELQSITGADPFEPPHISLLYTIDAAQKVVPWAEDLARLQQIAVEATRLVSAHEFTLEAPIVVAPDGEWTNIASWTVLRRL
jgi:2'-5' RNA ligase